MKIRKKYTLVILSLKKIAVVCRPKNKWVEYMQRNASFGCAIIDCNIEQIKYNLKYLSFKNFDIIYRKVNLIKI